MIELSEHDQDAAPCLALGPLAGPGRALVAAARGLGPSPRAARLRARCIPYLFDRMERAFASGVEPTAPLAEALVDLAGSLDVAGIDDLVDGDGDGDGAGPAEDGDVEAATGEHYGRLFQAFSPGSYLEEPARLLRERLGRNGIGVEGIGGRHVLDAGCGGGRYSVAWRLLGAGRVTGVDISRIGIADARERVRRQGIEGVEFDRGNVLELPYDSGRFDVVFSNGVLHHTTDWRAGVAELVRVLKPGGLGWLYLIESPGGLFWDVIEVLRVVMRGEGRDRARADLERLGIPANRVFYMLDHVMVPINVRLSPEEVEDRLAAASATGIRRLARGADLDRVERIARGEPHAVVKYGVGENRFVFSKG